MSRRLVAVVAVLVVAVLGAVVWLFALRGDGGDSSEVSARTPGGSLTFRMPDTWRLLECPSDEGDCVRVAMPEMNEGQAATVAFIPPNPVEGTPVDALINPDLTVPGSTRIIVDELPATRLDPDSAGQDTILVAGRARTEAGYAFMVICPEGGDAGRAREVCDQILGTLKVTR